MKSDPPVDLLFESLRHIALRGDHKLDKQSIFSALPVDAHQGVTPALFPRVAARAGFKASFSKAGLEQLESHIGPLIVLLEGNQVGVLFSNPDATSNEYFVLDVESELRPTTREVISRQYTGYAFTLVNVNARQEMGSAADMDIEENRRRWFWRTLWRYRGYYLQILPASLLVNLFALSMPFFVMIVYDKVVPNHAVETLWVLAIGVTLVYLFDLMIRLVRGALLERAGREMDFELAGVLFEQVLSLSLRSIPTSSGVLANRVKAYETLREFFVSAAMLALADLPFSLLMIGVIFFLAGPIGWLLLLAVVVGLAINVALQVPLYKSVKNATVSGIERHTLIGESLASLESVKANNAEGYLMQRMNKLLVGSAMSGVKSHWYALVGNTATTSLINLTSVAVIVVGVYQVSAGALSMGGLIATVMLTSRCMAPLAMVSGLMTRLQQTMQSLESLTDVMQMETEVDHRREYVSSESFKANFRLDKTVLSYPGFPTPALAVKKLEIKSSETVALLGRIGCGKSTLLKVMAGLLPPTSGALLINGIDVTQYHPAALRQQIGYVPQEVALFNGTLRDNIKLGDAQITDQKIIQAAANVGLDDYINSHPQGLNAEVGERGALLSGGQRCAVALARCLARNFPVLLLDEPTSNLDPQTEKTVINTLHQLKLGGQVSLVIATHKKGVLQLADRAIVMEKGQIVADGPPASVPGIEQAKLSKPEIRVSKRSAASV